MHIDQLDYLLAVDPEFDTKPKKRRTKHKKKSLDQLDYLIAQEKPKEEESGI